MRSCSPNGAPKGESESCRTGTPQTIPSSTPFPPAARTCSQLAGMGAGQAEAAIAAGADDAESGCSEQMRCALAIDERDELALDVIARLRPMNRACLMRLPRGNSALSEKWKSGYGRGQPLTTSDNFNANRGPSRSLG